MRHGSPSPHRPDRNHIHPETTAMKPATHIPGPLPDNPAPRQPEPRDAPDDFSLRGWLKHLTRYLGAVANAPPETVAMQPATYPPVPAPPAPPATREPESQGAPEGFGLLGWLRHFVLYLCAVATICLIGLYFLWQIPFLRDPSQLLGIADDSRAPRPLAPTFPSAAPTPPIQAASPPVNPTVTPRQPSLPTDAVVTVTAPPPTPTDPAGAPLSPEALPAAAPDGQTEPAPAPIEPTAETVSPPPPTPQAEIEQLLTDAQQQMDNRRFTAPASGNALSTYRRVLELQPDHPTAIEGIQRITTYYRDIAQQSLQQGRLDESQAYINRGLRATPQSDALLSLRRQVQQTQKAARQREREERQKQAALEEMQRQQLEQIQQEQLRRQQEQQPWWRQPSNYNDSSGFNQR